MLLLLESKFQLKSKTITKTNLRLENKKLLVILKLFEKDLSVLSAPLSRGAEKIIEAARYGEIRYEEG